MAVGRYGRAHRNETSAASEHGGQPWARFASQSVHRGTAVTAKAVLTLVIRQR
ncbi:hypothetical protein [Streptomyces sp. AVP053U2]|uniref:hypothetical protein n=1 Tax=Streptomyces sp. AVP053U2 TaxID=1737066 RepID=UPI00159F2462|nr:hypothetical protein [Streptomyces sp. AVP053U2]